MTTEAAHVDAVGFPVKLGRKKTSPKPKVQLATYLDVEQLLPGARRSVGHAIGLSDFKMCGNDSLGDCTCAAVEHGLHILQWQDKHGTDNSEDEQRAIDLYWATGSQDDGRMNTDVLGYVRQNGYGGRKDAVLGYAGVDYTNIGEVSLAIDLLGGVDIGISMPLTAQRQRMWDVVGDPQKDPNSAPGSWGGHAVWMQAYNRLSADNSRWLGLEAVVTWGMRLYLTQAFWSAYVDEALAVVSGEWLDKLGRSPRGFDVAALESDLKAISGQAAAK